MSDPAKRPIVKFDCCDACEHARTEGETGAGFCAFFGVDFDACPSVSQARQLEDIALDVASWIARHLTGLERDEAAAHAAVMFAEWFALPPMHATLDDEAFLARCGVRAAEAVCHGA